MPKLSRGWIVSIIIFLIIVADQALKLWIKTNMELHDSVRIADWFYIYFTENNGMAFGIELFDKLFLTLFRIAAVIALFWYLFRISPKKTTRFGYCICVGLIIAGALGNIIDSLFYGLIFNQSYGQVATLFPAEGGYGKLFYGKVVDMLYFPLIHGRFPQWMPFIGGQFFEFFRPIFNLADSSITVGISLILLFFRRDLAEVTTTKEVEEVEPLPEN